MYDIVDNGPTNDIPHFPHQTKVEILTCLGINYKIHLSFYFWPQQCNVYIVYTFNTCLRKNEFYLIISY